MGGPGREETEDDGGSARNGGGGSPLEWVVAAFSALLVLGTIGFLVHDALGGSSPPAITIEVDSIMPAGQGFLVEFRARNDGQSTAAGLVVEGEIRSDTGTVEKSQVTIDYVPADGMRQAGLFFTHDPRKNKLEIRPTGYDRP